MHRIVVEQHTVPQAGKPPRPRRGRWIALTVVAAVGAGGGWLLHRTLSAPPAWRALEQQRQSSPPPSPAEIERRILQALATRAVATTRLVQPTHQPPAPSAERPEPPAAAPVEPAEGAEPPSGSPAPTVGTRDAPRRNGPSERQETGGGIEVELTLAEVNALLDERRVRWQAESGRVGALSDVALALEGDQLVLYAQISTTSVDLLLGLPIELAIEDGAGSVRLLGTRLGQLPLPGYEALVSVLERTGDPRLVEIAGKVDLAVAGYPFSPWLEIGGEPVAVTAVRPDGARQSIVLTLEPGG